MKKYNIYATFGKNQFLMPRKLQKAVPADFGK
jgi:hypothetical protein